MKLSDTFFESLKITWKNKPMWKFVFYIYLPIFLISMLMYIAPIILLILEENGLNPIQLGRNGGTIISVLMIVSAILYIAIFFSGYVAMQLGANIQCWQQCNGENISRKKDIFKNILRKILPSLPGYLVFIAMPYLLYIGGIFGSIFLLTKSEEPAFIILFFLAIFVFLFIYYLGMHLNYIFIPVTSHDQISFNSRLKLAWIYIRDHFWDVFVYSLLVGIFDFIANIIIFIPYWVIYVILYIPTIMLMIHGDTENYFIVFGLFMLIIIIVATLIAQLKNLINTTKQTALTSFYYQKYSASEEMQKIAPLSPPVLME